MHLPRPRGLRAYDGLDGMDSLGQLTLGLRVRRHNPHEIEMGRQRKGL
uniref:Uncharacterized protein n=1 Tax=Picea sitchensis TaxID=3332 RepID=A0A6B9XVU3_PICSI|nr:hypothetical protein Q903MT_gene5455 [Picea sitchensis]